MPGELALLTSALDAAESAAALLDGEGQVRHLTPAARLMLGTLERLPPLDELTELARSHQVGMDRRELPGGWAVLALSDRGRREKILQVALHDLRSPLANVRSYAGLLLRGRGTPDKLQRMAEVIARNTERALRLIGLYLDSELLQLGTGPLSLHLESTSLAPLIEAAAASRRPLLAERGVALALATLPELRIPADGDRLTSAFESVLDRAGVRTPEGGTVRMSMTSSPSEAAVEIRDEGGAPDDLAVPRDRQILVDHRLYPAIGLDLARAALQAHGGSLEISPEGRGALWRLRLPMR